MKLYQTLLGQPFVYNKLRPFLLGGLDLSPFYRRIQASEEDVILDVGCGTGNALDYLERFRQYEGFDTDALAINSAKAKATTGSAVTFHHAECTPDDVRRIAPTHVVLCGLLHHLPDDRAQELLGMARLSPRLEQLFTLDIVYLEGLQHTLSNTLAFCDRGRYCRRPVGYRRLAEAAGLEVTEDALLWNHPKRHIARYFIMTLQQSM